MLDFYYVATPQGQQLLMFLEETGLPYRRIPQPQRLAMVDHWPADGGDPLPLQESGAMLLYLAEKSGFGMPTTMRARTAAREWLFWQKAFECQGKTTAELLGVLERQLSQHAYLCGDSYSVADIACFPWISARGQGLSGFPNVARWFHAVSQRPATQRAYGREMSTFAPAGSPYRPKVDIAALAGVLP